MIAADALRDGIRKLRDAGIDGATRDARHMLSHAMAIDVQRLVVHLQDVLPLQIQTAFFSMIVARSLHQPVSQIVGTRQFWGRRFHVTRDTLDPRPETECLIEIALRHPFGRVLDLGTGTGCILLSLLAERGDATGVGSDISPGAIAVAARNAQELGLGDRADLVVSDWFSDLAGEFDLIVSNPPYITEHEMAGLAKDVREWEPHLALTPGGDGLGAFRQIAADAGRYLAGEGRLLLEIGALQGAAVTAILVASGFHHVETFPDFDGRDRVILAIR